MIILGIDPGKTGALASWDGKKLTTLAIADCTYKMKSKKNKGKEVILWQEVYWSMARLWGDANGIKALAYIERVYIEHVHAMPKQGVVSMFNFGYNAGVLRGLVTASHSKDPIMVIPQSWKKHYGLSGSSKIDAHEKARRLFPERSHGMFLGPKDGLRDGVVDAALIARYGFEIERDMAV